MLELISLLLLLSDDLKQSFYRGVSEREQAFNVLGTLSRILFQLESRVKHRLVSLCDGSSELAQLCDLVINLLRRQPCT